MSRNRDDVQGVSHRTRVRDDLESLFRARVRDHRSRRTDDNRHSYRPRSREIPLETPSFPRMLASAALKKHKVGPLYAERQGRKMIRLRALQHMVVCDLRRSLARQVKTICDSGSASDMEEVRKTMKKYGLWATSVSYFFFQKSLKGGTVCALRDLRYMLEAPSQNDEVSEFLIERLYIKSVNDAAIMIDAGFMEPTGRSTDDLHVPDYTGYGGWRHTEYSEMQQSRDFAGRLGMALFGGFSLIVPMLIMRLHPTLLTELLTTSVFVLSLGIILAWFMKDARKADILAATASYAAVLVVFVGTTA